MTAKFYTYSGELEEVNKQLGTAQTVTGVRLLPGESLISPRIECEFSSRPTYNYVYISDLGRYYFIGEWTFGGGYIWIMTLNVDVLMSHSDRLDDCNGTVDYSALGSKAIIDRRMTFTDCPTVVRNSASISSSYYYAVTYLSNADPQPHVAMMTAAAFGAMTTALGALSNDKRALAYSCLLNVTLAYNVAFQTTAATTTTMLLWQTSFLDANEPVISLTITGGYYDIADCDAVRNIIKYTDYDVSTLGMTTSSGDFWDINARWTIMIPHTGSISFSPSDFGVTTVTSTKIRVFYEPYESAYVLVPIINSNAYYSAMIVAPANTKTILPIDSRYDNLAGQATATALSVGGSIITSVASIAGGISTANPALIGVGASQAAGAVAQTINGVNDYRTAKAAAAVSGTTIGSAGGSPSWVDANLGSYIRTLKITATLQGSASTFRSRWSMPDGAVRAASAMDGLGYFKFGDVEIDNVTGMTSTEVEMLKSQLLAGVRWTSSGP